jgi:hypothetical protein
MSTKWIRLHPLSDVLTLGGGYLRSEDGRLVIFARRYRVGSRGSRRPTLEYTSVEYLEGASYRTGGKNRTLYRGSNLAKAKAAHLP